MRYLPEGFGVVPCTSFLWWAFGWPRCRHLGPLFSGVRFGIGAFSISLGSVSGGQLQDFEALLLDCGCLSGFSLQLRLLGYAPVVRCVVGFLSFLVLPLLRLCFGHVSWCAKWLTLLLPVSPPAVGIGDGGGGCLAW